VLNTVDAATHLESAGTMPTYRYRCAKCGDETEIWQSFDEKPKTRHAGGCGGKLQKVMSPAGIVLKGSGFYKTDNRSSKSGAKANGKESSKESSGSESKSKELSSDSSKSDSGSSSKKETAGSSSSGNS
jgi:putative FmdB family regulatory protein